MEVHTFSGARRFDSGGGYTPRALREKQDNLSLDEKAGILVQRYKRWARKTETADTLPFYEIIPAGKNQTTPAFLKLNGL